MRATGRIMRATAGKTAIIPPILTAPVVLSASGLLFPSLLRAQIPEGWEIVKITNDPEVFDGSPDINDRGQIVFHRRFTLDVNSSEVMLYDRGSLIQITDDEVRDANPSLNNLGEIVWSRDVDGDATSRDRQQGLQAKRHLNQTARKCRRQKKAGAKHEKSVASILNFGTIAGQFKNVGRENIKWEVL